MTSSETRSRRARRGTAKTLKPATATISEASTASQKNAATNNPTTTRAARIISAARQPDRTITPGSLPGEPENCL
jgi:hypothetical protein